MSKWDSLVTMAVFGTVLAATVHAFSSEASAEGPQVSVRSISPFEAQVKAIDGGKTQDRITGGANAAPVGAYPWVVSLGVKNVPHTIGHFCGAVLIAHGWVLTAAHCLAKKTLVGAEIRNVPDDPSKIEVLVGTNSLSAGGNVRLVEKIIMHPDYRVDKDNVPQNDLALLRLTSTADQKVIPLMAEAQSNQFFAEDSKVLISGWGKVAFGDDQPLSNGLLHAFVSVLDRVKCNASDMYNGMVSEGMLCAGLGVVDACQGDSGGPAMAYIAGTTSPVLAGIVSWGVSCGGGKYPGVYVKVSKFSGWISSEMAK